MKTRLLFILFMLSVPAMGCDICGCYMGITPYDNQSSIGIFHRYRSFNGYPVKNQSHFVFPIYAYKQNSAVPETSLNTPTTNNNGLKHGGHTTTAQPQYDPSDFEIYKAVELRGKYFVHKRIELNAIIPFVINTTLHDGYFTKLKGIGDINLFSGFHLIRKIEVEGWQHRLIGGLGIKLPTGYTNAQTETNVRHDYMLQTGTGSTDGFVYANYITGIQKFGLNMLGMYKINGTNRFHEKTGNSFTGYFTVFMRFKYKNWFFVPSLQNNYEYTKGLYINKQLQAKTTMHNLMSGFGLDVFYKNVGLNLSYQLCAMDKTANTNLHSAGRMVVGVSYNFKQTKYIL